MTVLRSAALRSARAARPLARSYASQVPNPPEWEKPYPQLPDVSRQERPPRGWWDTQMRRNLGETLHERDELYSMWGPDIPHVDPKVALRHFIIAAAGFATIGFACKTVLQPDMPAVRREYPYSGLQREMGGLGDHSQRAESVDDDE